MKNLIVLALLMIASTAVFAQPGKRDQLTAEQRIDLRVKKMTLDLNLSDAQQKEVKALMTEQQAKFDKARETRKEAKEAEAKRTSEERYKMQSELLDNQIAHKAKMKKILSADQFAKWEENQGDRHEKMRERAGKHRDKKHMRSATPK